MESLPPDINLSATQQPRILGADLFTYCLAVLVVILRFISRKISKAPYWWDDWLMVPAIVRLRIDILASLDIN